MIRLSHEPNPDITGGYWEPPEDDGRPRFACFRDLADASRLARSYMSRNGLGSGNWTGGQVISRALDGAIVPVGRVAYNGRLFNMDDEPIE